MSRAKRVCTEPGCPVLVEGGRCTPHTRQRDQARGTKAERGYGAEHWRLRKAVAAEVAAGRAVCARCGMRLSPSTPWHLDHTDDRRGYLGPSHTTCNLSAAGRKSHG